MSSKVHDVGIAIKEFLHVQFVQRHSSFHKFTCRPERIDARMSTAADPISLMLLTAGSRKAACGRSTQPAVDEWKMAGGADDEVTGDRKGEKG